MSNIALGLYKYVDGVNDTPFPSSANQAFLVDWQYGARRMGGAPSITGGTINHTICLDNDWSMDVYVEYKGEKFFPSHKPTSSYSAQSITYEHKVDFYSERLVLDNVYFYDVVSSGDSGGKPVSNSTKFTFFGNITEFIARLNASMQRANTGYSAVLDPNQANADLEKQIKFDTKYISEALQEGFKAFGIPYYFVGKVCHYGDSQSSAIDNIVFEYGKDNSLMSIEKTNANTKIVNRITGVGSGDNIPYYYPNSCEQGVVDIANLSSSTITNLEIFDDMLFAKKVKRDAVLTYNMWSFNVDTPIFYLDGKPYTNGKGFSSDEIAQGQTLHVVVPFEVKYDGCTDLFMRFSVRPVATAISNLSLSPAISGVTPTADNGMVYVNALNKNIAKGKYQLAFDVNISTFSLILQVFKTEACTIYANGWKDNKDDNFYGDLEEIGIMMTGTASAGDNFKQIISKYIPPQSNLMPSIYRDSDGDERFYNATNNTYVNPDTGEYYEFPNPYANGKPKEFIKDYKDVKPTIAGAVNSASEPIDQIIKFAYDENDNDDLEEDGVTYKHPYFFALLHRTNGTYGFNLFDHTIDEGEMSLSFTSGRMGGCEFVIGVGEDSQKNLVQIALDGNLQPQLDEDGHPILVRDAETGDVICGREGQGKQIPQEWQNDTRRNEVWVALKKDSTTYGVIMPNATNNYRPSDDEVNEFVILHIDLPKAYILAAEQSIDNLLISYMAESNTEHWNFGIDFSRIYLKDTPNIANALDENKKIKIRYNGEIYSRYVLGYTYKTLIGEPLPSISIELAESLEGSTSALDTAINEINNMVEQQANAMIGYQQIARLARGALQTSNVEGAGSSTRPIYFDGHEAKVIDGLDVPESIRTQKNVEAMWGVSAFGIANMAISGTGGGGTVTAVSVNGNRYTPSNGLITLPDYPTAASLINDGLASRAWAYQNFAGKDYETRVQAIEALIPAQASSENQVADKAFVNSSVATATAEFQGTYDVVEDLGLTASATHAQIQAALLTAVASKQPDNNDYVFVSIPAVGSASGRYERYKFNGTSWAYEYTLNNSSFTAAQWGSINSGITENKVSGYDAHLARTDNPHSVTKAQVGLGNVENTALSTWVGTNNITTLGTITTGVWHGTAIADTYIASAAAWNAKQNALAFDGTYDASTNKVATESTVTNAINALDVSNITGFGAGKTLASLTETDGKIAATFQDISITKSQVSDFPTTWALADITGADDLKAIEALTGTSGFLKKTAANTWSLDTDVASGTALSDVSTRVGTLEGYFSNGKLNSANIDLATGDNNGQVKIAGTNVSVKGWNTAATHAHGDYVTAVGIDATNGKLKWYLGGVAQTAPNIVAARLVDTNKTMFGNTYWTSSGIPASIGTATAPAALDYVTNIDGLLYFDKTNRKVEVGTSASPADIQSFGGVSALGIANMAINGGGGQGTLTQIRVNGTAIADVNGVVNITATTGNANGKIAIAGQQIPVYGLGTLAYASSLSFDNLSSHPTTLGGYGITDAKIANGVITLGSNTITPLTGINATMINNALGFTLSGTSGQTYNLATISSNASNGNTAFGYFSNGVLPASKGGTGKTSLSEAGSAIINALGVGASNAERDDYIVAQYAGGGTTTTTYLRRKLSNIFAALNSGDITTALGYTPYNATNPNGYISGITSSMVTTALGYTPFNNANFTKANIKSTLGISDWALAASKPSYAFSEITGTVTNAQLAGSIANNKLANSSISIAGTSVSLGGSITAATLKSNLGLGASAYVGYDTEVTQNSTKLITSGAVYNAIDNLPEPMIMKGTLGTNGTITSLPTASASNEGFTYKVITAGTYASQAAKVGDVFVSCKPVGASAYEWILIPAGDTDSDTWRNIKVNGTQLLGTAISSGAVNFKNGGNITLTGSGNDITLGVASGYAIPTTAKQGNWDTAYGWGNHASAGYALASNLGTASTHAHGDYVTGMSWDSTNNKLAWSKGGTAQTAITIGYASSAGKLNTNAGNATNPVYFANGVPVACTYSLNKTVPADAVFTDTTYSANNGVGLSGTTFYNSGVRAATINGNYLRINTNGTNADLTIPYATKASQDNDGTAFKGYYLRKVSVPNNTENDFNTFESMTLTGRGDPTTGASLVHAPWSGVGPAGGYGTLTYLWSGYGIQMAWGYHDNHIYIRNKYYNSAAVWSNSWSTVALTSDNVASATKLKTARTINGTSFDGTANITTANWGTARNISIADSDSTNTGTAVSVNGSAAVTLKLPATIKATLSGNASSATKATNDSDGNAINTTYLKKSGGTMTGALNISTANWENQLILNRVNNATNWGATIVFKRDGNYDTDLMAESGHLYVSGDTGNSRKKVWDEANDGAGSGLDADKLDGQEGSYYATASSVTTLQGYFTSGVANSAAKLTTVSKTAWGQTFWTSGGIPASISGNMTNVGDITPSADKTKDIGSQSLQFSFVYASRFLTSSGAGMRYCATTGRHGWYNSYTTDSTTKQMELDANSNLTVQGDVMGMGGVSAMGIASMAINSMSGISFASQIAMNGQTYNATSGLITLPNFTDAYNPSGTGSTTQALSQKGAKALYNAVIGSLPSTTTVAGWGYKKGMVYSTSTASDSGIQVATGADPTYQYITNTSQSSLIITVTTSNAAANSYGVHRYIMIYNNRSSATLVQFADQGQGVVGPADNVTIPANSYMEFSIIHPASNAKCMVTWSMPLKDITTM